MIRFGCVVLLLSGCVVGDATEPAKDKHAEAAIAPTAANTVTGTIKFTLHDGKVSAVIEAANAPEGVHGFHIHLNPACGNDGMDAGPHWDGATGGDPTTHGLPEGVTHHYGDLGNITIGADGTGTMMATRDEWTLGDGMASDIVPHAVIFHANMDDGTMPSAGARIGCGVIAATN